MWIEQDGAVHVDLFSVTKKKIFAAHVKLLITNSALQINMFYKCRKCCNIITESLWQSPMPQTHEVKLRTS
jgi:hypothetical protein